MAVLAAGQALGLGNGLACKRFTIGEAELTAAATSQTIALFTLPKGSIILGVRIKHRTAFAGASVTAVTVSVGTTTLGAAGLASAFDILQAVAAGTKQLTQ